MRRLAQLIMLAGVLLALYPLAQNIFRERQQQAFLESFAALPKVSFNQLPRNSYETGAADSRQASDTNKGPQAIGVLTSEKIGLRIPLFHGISRQSLKTGAGLLIGSAEPGHPGNTVLAAHRAHKRGQLFNRLDELSPADTITITTVDTTYEYTVISKTVADKDDLTSLRDTPGEHILTLITCHPLNQINPPYRIIVQAKMNE